ncbi:MAG: EFR1 family ferrodoxin [Candidatus Thermoplasmatota archaeon]|nr:EFR1 family ferrodoxin [Candidatus Thermoplasmatota archaeon]
MEKTEIYYFSGTGNSLHIAKELERRIPNIQLIPIVGLSNEENVKTKAENVGFVFPIYFTTIPTVVRRFIERLNLDSAQYIFSIVTRAGSFCVANINVRRILKKKKKTLDAHFILNMAYNTPTGLKPGKGYDKWVEKIDAKNIDDLESEIQSQLNEIEKTILNKDRHPKKLGFHPFRGLLERIMYALTRNIKTQIKYITDSSCTGCGICEKVCLSNKIKLDNKKPYWDENIRCYYCYACFNFCPTQSILVKKKWERKDGRYHHPDVNLKDIIHQKKNS